jgi:hypothetical protein
MTALANPRGYAPQREPAGLQLQIYDFDPIPGPLPSTNTPNVTQAAKGRLERKINSLGSQPVYLV